MKQVFPRLFYHFGFSARVLEVEQGPKALELVPWEVLCQSISWHLVRRQVGHLEGAFGMLLTSPHVLNIYMAQLGGDSLVLSYD